MKNNASMGVFTRDAAGCFGLTPLGETLRSDVQGSLRDKALFEIPPDAADRFSNRCWA
jgi:hypothetical protein